MTNWMKTLVGSVMLLGLMLTVGGCVSSDQGDQEELQARRNTANNAGVNEEDYISAGDVRADMTPALDSTARSTQQDYNRYARSIDHTTRQAWDDIAAFLLIDEPSHLTEYPIP